MKKIFVFLLLTFTLFSKSFTLSIGIENPGDFSKIKYSSNSNPRIDIDYMHYFNKFGIGMGGGIDYINVNNENYTLTTSLSLNTAFKLIEMENYSIYTQLNIGYPYSFITYYHMKDALQYVKPSLYHELKLGVVYNDFNINLGLSTTYLTTSEHDTVSDNTLTRLSINLGFLAF